MGLVVETSVATSVTRPRSAAMFTAKDARASKERDESIVIFPRYMAHVRKVNRPCRNTASEEIILDRVIVLTHRSQPTHDPKDRRAYVQTVASTNNKTNIGSSSSNMNLNHFRLLTFSQALDSYFQRIQIAAPSADPRKSSSSIECQNRESWYSSIVEPRSR